MRGILSRHKSREGRSSCLGTFSRILLGASALTLAANDAIAGSVCVDDSAVDPTIFNSLLGTVALPGSSGSIELIGGTTTSGRPVYLVSGLKQRLPGADDPDANPIVSDLNLLRGAESVNLTFQDAGPTVTNTAGSISAGASVISSLGSFGPPSISTVEISSNQAEEFVRQRRELAAAQLQEVGTETATEGAPGGATPTATPPVPPTAPASQPAVGARVAQKQTKSKRKATRSSPAVASKRPLPDGSALDQDGRVEEREHSGRKFGAWANVYGDYEEHKNLAPGSVDNPKRRQYTFGQMGGVDMSWQPRSQFPGIVQVGFFGGHNETRSKFSDTPNVSDASQRDDGGFFGGYLTYQRDRLSIDTVAKVDLFQLNKRAIIRNQVRTPVDCATDQVLLIDRRDEPLEVIDFENRLRAGEVSEHNYTVGTNIQYRFDLSERSWFEPTAGVRFTYTDFGADAWTLDLQDGRVLRVQAGARIGSSWSLGGQRVFSASLLGLAYSDVWVDGFALLSTGFVSTVSNVDEGKLRGLAQLNLKLEDGRGTSYGAEVGVRGGEDVWGVGGRLGVRYEW